MIIGECPACQRHIELAGCEELEIIQCPACSMFLEIVSLHPPILEESLEGKDDEGAVKGV